MALPPLSQMGQVQQRELADALEHAGAVEDLPGKWQAAILQAEHAEGGSGGIQSAHCHRH